MIGNCWPQYFSTHGQNQQAGPNLVRLWPSSAITCSNSLLGRLGARRVRPRKLSGTHGEPLFSAKFGHVGPLCTEQVRNTSPDFVLPSAACVASPLGTAAHPPPRPRHAQRSFVQRRRCRRRRRDADAEGDAAVVDGKRRLLHVRAGVVCWRRTGPVRASMFRSNA